MTISYGPWPNDVLLQQWGFVPEFNPYDAVALFDNFEDLLCQIAACNSERGMLKGHILLRRSTWQGWEWHHMLALCPMEPH